VQGFKQNACELQASALTLYTLLSIVPVIAMLFGIAKGFGLEKILQQQLLTQIPKHDTLLIRLIEFAQNMLINTQGGVVAGMGVVVLFWTVIKVISMVEEAFNQIWQIKQGRTLARKLSDYLSLMLFAPIFLVVACSMTVFVYTQINWLVKVLAISNSGSAVLLTILNYLPMLIMAGLFSFVFAFIPNQKVQPKAAIIAGTITGIIYQLVQAAYLGLQVGVSSYNAIYGSFAALPLFLLWVQLGWLIVLFGCEIAFFIQHYETYRHNQTFSDLSFSLKKVLALQITHILVQRFAHAEKALSMNEIAKQLNLPIVVVQTILASLIEAQMVAEIKSKNGEESLFQPSQDTDLISVYAVIAGLENQGVKLVPQMMQSELFIQINEKLNLTIQTAAENYLLKQLTGGKA
jgi:membrane protein